MEAHSAYRAAWRAADLPEYDRDSLELSVGTHRVRVQAWEREQAWGPAYVDNLLAGTHQAAEQHRQTAELRRAEAAGALEPAERARLDVEADDAFALAEQLGGEVGRLEEVSDVYAKWSAETAMTRALADQSRAVLAMHDASAVPEQRVTAAEWLAAERDARREDDPHRAIADADVEQHEDSADPQPDHHQAAGESDPGEHRDDASERDTAPEDDPAEQARRAAVDAAETDVPDVREAAEAEPRPRDEDAVRPPEPDETEAELSRARRAVVEVANRQELEQQHAQYDRAEQLSRWHDDQTEPTAEPADADHEEDHGDGEY